MLFINANGAVRSKEALLGMIVPMPVMLDVSVVNHISIIDKRTS